jgi:catechol 2,3-dioxygenase-like lactoylglutathione lyase family enzyme
VTAGAEQGIARLALNVRDLEGVAAFYQEGLGFEAAGEDGEGGLILRLGAEEIVLRRQPPGGGAYPDPRAANDPWFQHFAIAVADMEAAYGRLARLNPQPITRGGPTRLPPSTGSVTAVKVRDPEGRPLELTHIPGSAWLSSRRRAEGALFLGIADLDKSSAFYERLGFVRGERLLNTGPAQDRLDGLDGVVLDILVLTAPRGGPHIELLHYRAPTPAPPRRLAAGDLAASAILLARSAGAAAPPPLRDPDGHPVEAPVSTSPEPVSP